MDQKELLGNTFRNRRTISLLVHVLLLQIFILCFSTKHRKTICLTKETSHFICSLANEMQKTPATAIGKLPVAIVDYPLYLRYVSVRSHLKRCIFLNLTQAIYCMLPSEKFMALQDCLPLRPHPVSFIYVIASGAPLTTTSYLANFSSQIHTSHITKTFT